MQERGGHLPGYTGHVPKLLSEEVHGIAHARRPQIPNYQGFIPGVKSENLFGQTYGRITEASALNEYHKGRDLPLDSRYQTVTKMTYKNQLRIPVMPLRPKVYPPAPVDPVELIPDTTLAKFYGVHDPRSRYEVTQAQTSFYRKTLEDEAGPEPEDLGTAYKSFWGDPTIQVPTDEPKLSFEDARKLATQYKA